MTRDLATHASKIVATDLDDALLKKAATSIADANVEFLHTPGGRAEFPPGTFDFIIYTLSLHHIPESEMPGHLEHSGAMLTKNGAIVVIEPGNGGSFLEVKKRFGAGSGDERPLTEAADRVIHRLHGWTCVSTCLFDVDFLFSDKNDFISNKLPNHTALETDKKIDLDRFLTKHETERGIILSSQRKLTVMRRG
ncbi:MAG: SAM-dependent methyltransferase [Desulfuromonas sp.]|nr:MAG: SAM-dependent methyltransferase [Desulfuromonas sp.]